VQNFISRQVFAENIVALNETMAYSDFLRLYFKHEHTEDLPGDNIFAKYIYSTYQPLIFNVSVADGQLNLRFHSDQAYACTVSGVIIFPTSRFGDGARYLSDLWQQMERHYNWAYFQSLPLATSNSNVTPSLVVPYNGSNVGVGLFSRARSDDVNAFDQASAADHSLEVSGLTDSLMLNATTTLSFSIWATMMPPCPFPA